MSGSINKEKFAVKVIQISREAENLPTLFTFNILGYV